MSATPRRLGFVSAILADQTLDDVLSTAKATGYDCVELMCWPRGKAERRYAGVTHVDVETDEPGAIRELCEKHGVGISGLGYYPNLLSPDDTEAARVLSHLKRVIEFAPKLDVRIVNTFVGRNPALSVDDNWPRVMEIWPELARLASDSGVKIGIENCPMLYTNDEWPGGKNLATSPKIWRRLFSDIASESLGLNYDPSHLVWQLMDPIAPVREFGGRFVHVHAKDVKLDRAALSDVGILAAPLEYHAPKLPGLGEIDWGRFFAALSDSPYSGPVVVEVEDRAYEGSLEGRRAALAQANRYLRNFC